jgi:hypothetical protein
VASADISLRHTDSTVRMFLLSSPGLITMRSASAIEGAASANNGITSLSTFVSVTTNTLRVVPSPEHFQSLMVCSILFMT